MENKKLGKLRKIVDDYGGNFSFIEFWGRGGGLGNEDGRIFPAGDIHKN